MQGRNGKADLSFLKGEEYAPAVSSNLDHRRVCCRPAGQFAVSFWATANCWIYIGNGPGSDRRRGPERESCFEGSENRINQRIDIDRCRYILVPRSGEWFVPANREHAWFQN